MLEYNNIFVSIPKSQTTLQLQMRRRKSSAQSVGNCHWKRWVFRSFHDLEDHPGLGKWGPGAATYRRNSGIRHWSQGVAVRIRTEILQPWQEMVAMIRIFSFLFLSSVQVGGWTWHSWHLSSRFLECTSSIPGPHQICCIMLCIIFLLASPLPL